MEQTRRPLSDFSTTELKAIAFDNIVELNQRENTLEFINKELASRAQNTQSKTKMDETNNTPATEEVIAGGEEATNTEAEVATEATGTEEVA